MYKANRNSADDYRVLTHVDSHLISAKIITPE